MTGALLSLVLAQAPESSPALSLIRATSETEFVDQLNEDGRHVRFGTKDQGPVHVWRPRAFRAQGAVTVIYLHGFYTDVDHAILEHQLLTQFRDSGRNALFIVPEARSGRFDPVFWRDLPALLSVVERRLKQKVPERLVVVGHSGAYKTVAEWLEHQKLEQVLLIDGLYGNDDEFHRWVSAAEANSRQLVLIGFDTQQRSEWFLKKHPEAARLDDVPYLFDELPASVRKAKLVFFPSERFDHMGLVTSGRLVPWLLHAFR